MSENQANGGISISVSWLAILFIGLKLGGVIAWSWWWVLSPIWIPIAFVLLVATAIATFSYLES